MDLHLAHCFAFELVFHGFSKRMELFFQLTVVLLQYLGRSNSEIDKYDMRNIPPQDSNCRPPVQKVSIDASSGKFSKEIFSKDFPSYDKIVFIH